jgi:hypothetical protein
MLRVLHRSIGSLLGANPLVDIRIVSAGDIVEYQAFQRSVLRDFQTQRLSFVRRSSRLQRCTDERSNPSTLYRLKGGFATVVSQCDRQPDVEHTVLCISWFLCRHQEHWGTSKRKSMSRFLAREWIGHFQHYKGDKTSLNRQLIPRYILNPVFDLTLWQLKQRYLRHDLVQQILETTVILCGCSCTYEEHSSAGSYFSGFPGRKRKPKWPPKRAKKQLPKSSLSPWGLIHDMTLLSTYKAEINPQETKASVDTIV